MNYIRVDKTLLTTQWRNSLFQKGGVRTVLEGANKNSAFVHWHISTCQSEVHAEISCVANWQKNIRFSILKDLSIKVEQSIKCFCLESLQVNIYINNILCNRANIVLDLSITVMCNFLFQSLYNFSIFPKTLHWQYVFSVLYNTYTYM